MITKEEANNLPNGSKIRVEDEILYISRNDKKGLVKWCYVDNNTENFFACWGENLPNEVELLSESS